ncbi:hypothetical protein ACHHYP_00371 [Achlya hypogyna]|uniref:Uncharacterized protein n=1 Tax=Achlya hypogyna TaxID=1202772 RepID=A0A1V9ZAX1_ACHHY|nr:hypothetical protein ACHHYP_00371 [Achlya hypogyna]
MIARVSGSPHQRSVWFEVCGLGYVVTSVALSWYSLFLFAPFLESDFFWPFYTTANTSAILPSVVNLQLTFLPLLNDSSLWQPGAGVQSTETGVSPVYPRLLMYQELTTLPDAVAGLREMSVRTITSLVTLYCWVDLGRMWEMAYTAARQKRCEARYASNAAVHLEAVLRNTDLDMWLATSSYEFMEGIGLPIAATNSSGADWLDNLLDHPPTTIAGEVTHWRSFNLSHFTLAYGNRIQIGLEETLLVRNAFGFADPVRLKSMPTVLLGSGWTSSNMNDLLSNGLAVLAANQSLVRGTPGYFGLKNPNAIEIATLGLPLNELNRATRAALGPFLSVDLQWLPPPPELLRLVFTFRAVVVATAAANPIFREALASLSSLTLAPTPRPWANASYLFYGGNPMCSYGDPLSFVQQAFSFDDGCASQEPLTVPLTAFNALFALAMLQGGDPRAICVRLWDGQTEACAEFLLAANKAWSYLPPTTYVPPPAVTALNLSLLQFVRTQASHRVAVQTLPILDPSWHFYGFAAVYDWVFSWREAVSFQGDAATFNLISAPYAPRGLPALPTTANVGRYLWYLAAVTTGSLSLAAVAVGGLWLRHGGSGTPWHQFNSVVASAWLPRSLLVVRGCVAVIGLSTAHVVPNMLGNFAWLQPTQKPVAKSALLAGEALWILHLYQTFFVPASSAPSLWAPGVAWVLLTALDNKLPVAVAVAMERTCSTHNMDQMIYCTSGTVAIGSVVRGGLVVFVPLACVLTTVLRPRPRVASEAAAAPSLLLPGLTSVAGPLDLSTAAMAGLFYVYRPRPFVLDIKLWRAFDASTYSIATLAGAIVLPSGPTRLPERAPRASLLQEAVPSWSCYQRRFQRVFVVAGFAYLVGTIGSNVLYLNEVEDFFETDFGWSGFNCTGAYAFLGNLVARQLMVTTRSDLALDSAVCGDISQLYNGTATTVFTSPTAARRQLFRADTPLAAVVRGLRDLDPCLLPWMFTQYCFVDLNRTWSMASTARRQERCAQYVRNGAVYLELPLRNVASWSAWTACWDRSFATGIAAALETTDAGRRWLDEVATVSLSVADEVALWEAHDIDRFVLQWQNYKTTGFLDVVAITTALGLEYPLVVSHSSGGFHLEKQTSQRMYWGLASDLWAIGSNATSVVGRSLVRESPAFAFANTTPLALLLENCTLVAPLARGLVVLEAAVGPFGAVDMVYVPVPPSLLAAFAAVQGALSQLLLLNASAQDTFLLLPTTQFLPQAPEALFYNASVAIVGGNLLCGNDNVPTSTEGGLSNFFGANGMCHSLFGEFVAASAPALLFATLGAGATLSGFGPSDHSAICILEGTPGDACQAQMAAYGAFAIEHDDAFRGANDGLRTAHSDTAALNIQIVQYVQVNSALELFQMELLLPTDRSWVFYAWALLYEWALGTREVVAFAGDATTLTVLSARENLLTMSPDPSQVPQTLAALGVACVQFITWVFIVVAALAAVHTLLHEVRHVEGLNLFELNRIVGHVWVGRPFLVVRSITALCMLNSSPLALLRVGAATRFVSPSLEWTSTALAASETLWLVYVFTGLASPLTQQYTPYYAPKSTAVVWTATVVWTGLSPHQYNARLDRSCDYVDMDMGLKCVSAYVEIGSLARVLVAAALGLGAVVSCYAAERWYRPNLAPLELHTEVLDALAYYMFDFTNWTVDGEFFIDPTSAILAGLVAVNVRGHRWVLDVKTWRVFTLPDVPSEDDIKHTRFHFALPLSRM